MKKYQLLAVLAILLGTCFNYPTYNTCKAENYSINSYNYTSYIKTQPRPAPRKLKPTATTYTPTSDSYHTVSTTTLNVRSRPSPNSSVVKKLKYKDKVIIIEATDAKWVKVQVGAVTGYTLRKSLSLW